SLVAEIRKASENIAQGDARMNQRLEGIEQSVNELYKTTQRPGAAWETKDESNFERKEAIGLCRNRRALTVPKIDGGVSDDYTPHASEIDEALVCRKAMKALMRYGDPARLDQTFQKSLSAFSFGGSGYLLPPEISNQVLRCIVDPTDITGMVNRVAISSGSIRFPIDNSRMSVGGWACEASCFANNPNADLSEGLGQLEIRAESFRFVQCATSDLLQDAAFNVEQWLIDKVSRGMRETINLSILLGDGVGKPMGFMHPQSGIPILDTSVATQPG